MIRRRLHKHWLDDGALYREVVRAGKGFGRIGRGIDWAVASEDENGKLPLWKRPIVRLIVWASDWRSTWRIRPLR